MTSPSEPMMELGPELPAVQTTIPTGLGNTVACDQCDRTFKNDWALNVHKSRKHSGHNWASIKKGSHIIPKRRTCPVCEKVFGKRQSMTHHLRVTHGKSIMDFENLRARGKSKPKPQPNQSNGVTAQVRLDPMKGKAVVFCPVCGTNIHAVQQVINFGERR